MANASLDDVQSGELDFAFGEMDEGEPGLGVPSALVRGDKSRLRAREVPSPEADATDLGERPPQLPPQVWPQLFAGQERFLLRLDA